MNDKVVRYFIYGQICLFLSVFVCILLLPEGLFANDGISYYSSHKTTVLPYTIGLLGVALFSFKVSQGLTSNKLRAIRRGFRAITALILVMVLFPYGINFTFEYSHTILSALLFFVQFAMVLWLAIKIERDTLSILLVLLMVAEMVITVMYLSPEKGYLLEGEVVFQLTFGLAVYKSLSGSLKNNPAKRGFVATRIREPNPLNS